MNISCSICAELFTNADGSNISVTPCGHAFHTPCLLQWLERLGSKHNIVFRFTPIENVFIFHCFLRSKTCPECRAKVTFSSQIRAYFNVSHTTDESRCEDNADQQQKIDSLKFQLVEKGVEIKKKVEEITSLRTDMAKTKDTLQKSQKVIIALEAAKEQNKILIRANCDQVCSDD